MNDDTIQIELTEEEILRWLMDLDADTEDLPTEFTITAEEEPDE